MSSLIEETQSPSGKALTLLKEDFDQALKQDLRLSLLGKTSVVSLGWTLHVLIPPKETLNPSGEEFPSSIALGKFNFMYHAHGS